MGLFDSKANKQQNSAEPDANSVVALILDKKNLAAFFKHQGDKAIDAIMSERNRLHIPPTKHFNLRFNAADLANEFHISTDDALKTGNAFFGLAKEENQKALLNTLGVNEQTPDSYRMVIVADRPNQKVAVFQGVDDGAHTINLIKRMEVPLPLAETTGVGPLVILPSMASHEFKDVPKTTPVKLDYTTTQTTSCGHFDAMIPAMSAEQQSSYTMQSQSLDMYLNLLDTLSKQTSAMPVMNINTNLPRAAQPEKLGR